MDDGFFHFGDIYVTDGVISDIDASKEKYMSAEIMSGDDSYPIIIPGLIDIHLHGCNGYDICDGDVKSVLQIAEYQKKHGITSFVGATMTLAQDKLAVLLNCLNEAIKKEPSICGVYLEGPFLSKEKCGAQNSEYFIAPNREILDKMQLQSGNSIKFVAIAPETENALSMIESGEFEFTLAHSAADYYTAKKAFDMGVRHVTHLYNAMNPLLSREPGIVGAAAENENVMVELIADGIHVHPAVVNATYKMFGDNRVILISDSMEATGLDDGEYELGGATVYVRGKRATLKDGTIAGSVSNLYDCFTNAVKMGIPLESALKSVTWNPSESLGMSDQIGHIRVGNKANLLIVNSKLDIIEVVI